MTNRISVQLCLTHRVKETLINNKTTARLKPLSLSPSPPDVDASCFGERVLGRTLKDAVVM